MSTTKTLHLLLEYLGRGDRLQDNDYAFGVLNMDRLDLAAYLGASGHHHNGQSPTTVTPVIGPTLQLDDSAGVLPAGTRIFYRYALRDDRGFETAASPESFIQTPAAITDPSAPVASVQNTGGQLMPGAYSYALSAYQVANTLETQAPNVQSVLLPAGHTTYVVTLLLPTLPAGAQGFNVYRRNPGNNAFHYIGSVDMQVATPPTTFVDDGTAVESERGLPQRNTTNAQNSVIVSIGGATPVVPPGYTWVLYRTLTSGQYSTALVHSVVEETSEGSGIITPTYTDLGLQTTSGAPSDSVFSLPNPERVKLTDAEEVQGVLPPANQVFMHVVEFFYEGTVAAAIGDIVWHCPFEEAVVRFVVLSLGKGRLAGGQDDIVDVNKWDSTLATPTWGTIFTTQANRPRIVVGHDHSSDAVPNVTKLVKGDKLTADIDQAGNAATPTDSDLLIQVVMWVKDSTATTVVFP